MTPIRVLLVDGDPDRMERTATGLADANDDLTVVTASDAADALDRVREDGVDCVVSDYRLPDTSGLALLRDVRETEPDVPVLISTAQGGPEAIAESVAAGATDCVERPTDEVHDELLASRVENAVARVRVERAGDSSAADSPAADQLADPSADGPSVTDSSGADPSDADDTPLSVSGANYREIFDKISDAVFVHDIETGEILDVNRKTCELLGVSRAEALDLRVEDFSAGVPPYTQEQAVEWIRKAATEGTQQFEWLAKRSDGTPFWMEVTLKRTTIGGVDRMLAVVRDVTERRKREETLDSLHGTTRALMTADSREEIARIATAAAEDILDESIAGLWLADDDEGLETTVLSPGAGARLDPANVPAPVSEFVEDVLDGTELRVATHDGDVVVDGSPLQATMAVPLGDHGVLAVATFAPGGWTDTEVEFADILAANAEVALDRTSQETALREERDRIGALFRNVTDAVMYAEYVDGRPIVREVNPAFEEVFGYDEATVIDQPLDEVIVPPEYDDQSVVINERVREGERVEMEVKRRTDEELRDFLLRVTPVELHGDRRGSFGVYTDITDRKRRERILEVLHESTRRLMQVETEGEIHEITIDTLEEVLGLTMAATLSFDPETETLSPTEMTDEMRRLYDDPDDLLTFEVGEGLTGRAFETGEAAVYDDIRTRNNRNGREARIRSAMMLPVGDHGVVLVGSQAVGEFDEFDRDFAELVAANTEAALDRAARERLLRERESQLVRERDRSTALFENIPDPAISCRFTDAAPIVRGVNSAFETVFGYDAETVVGDSLDEYIVPEGQTDEASDLNELLMRGENVHVEVRRETTDGVRDFLLHVVPFNVGERSANGYAIYTDITERKQRELELTRQNERLDEFTSIVTHDLRNPLNIAQGYLDVARSTGDDDHLEKVEDAHDRMNRLIEELLALARQGKLVGSVDRLDLESVVRDAWENVETDDASLDVADLPATEADAERLREMFENLFRNAVEHGSTSPHSRPEDAREDAVGPSSDEPSLAEAHEDAVEHGNAGVDVTVGAIDGGFFVADDGPGIPADERGKIFDSGYTTASDGTGFGLSIVTSIVEEHGWEISVTAGERGGARFEIRFDGESDSTSG